MLIKIVMFRLRMQKDKSEPPYYEKINALATVKLSYWDAQGRCTYANKSYLEWAQLEGRGFLSEVSEVVPGCPEAMEMLGKALNGEAVKESLHVQYGGRYYRVSYIPDKEGEAIKGCAIQLDDISELKEKEHAHHSAEQKFRTIVESAPDALIIADSLGNIVLLNSRAEELFGYAASELIQKPVELLMPERYRLRHPEKRQDFTKSRHSRAMGNLILEGLRKDGSVFPADVSLSPMKTSEGLLIAAAFRDITEKVAREKEIADYHQALLAQSSKVESILGSISESFCLIDSDWRVQYWNPAAEKTTGKLRNDVLGNFLWEVFPQDPLSKLYIECRRSMAERRSSAFEHHSSNGSWYYNSVHPSADGGLTIYFKDISERKRTEHEIVSVKNNQYALINATRDLMWSVDSRYRLISANSSFGNFVFDHYGYKYLPGDEILIDRNTGKRNIEWKAYFDRGLDGESFFVELDSMPDHLTQFNPIADPVSGEITGVACHSANTSERNRLEKEKRESAERFRAVVHSGSDLIFILDPQFSVNYVSPSASGLLGFSEGLRGAGLLKLVHPESVRKALHGLRETSKQRTVKIGDIRIRGARGEWIWIEATIDNLLDNAAVSGLVVNAKDLTDHKSREAERELLIRELTKSNGDLMQFSFITSHNLRSPLSNIRGLLHVLEQQPDPKEALEVLRLLDVSTQKLEDTITDLAKILFIRNNTEIPTRMLEVERIFHRVNRNFIEAENGIDATISLAIREPVLVFNEAYLESIFINLISNSIKYRSNLRPLHISMSTQKHDDGIRLVFADNGTGIDTARHKDRLFGMYQRFHSNTEGHGLGLFIVKAQVQALGGSIEIESKVDSHTRFIITFPAHEP